MYENAYITPSTLSFSKVSNTLMGENWLYCLVCIFILLLIILNLYLVLFSSCSDLREDVLSLTPGDMDYVFHFLRQEA